MNENQKNDSVVESASTIPSDTADTVNSDAGPIVEPQATPTEEPHINPQTSEVQKKTFKSLSFEIVGIGVIIILFFIAFSRVPASELSSLQSNYDSLQAKYKETAASLEAAEDDLSNVRSRYSDYKDKMKAFEGLSDEELNALVSEAEKITAEKKAKEEQEAAEKKALEEQAAAEAAAKQQVLSNATTEQKNALSTAKDYLDFTAFSYSGLIKQLEFEGYSNEAATFAVDNCGADWNAQAAKMAQSYLDFSSFSRSGLIDQLVYEGFSAEQAEYGVSSVGY